MSRPGQYAEILLGEGGAYLGYGKKKEGKRGAEAQWVRLTYVRGRE